MKRLMIGTALLLATVQSGQASLECDGYFTAGYFGTTYYQDGYFSETVCAGGGGGGNNNRPSLGLGLKRLSL